MGGKTELAGVLLEGGANASAKDQDGNTALIEAVCYCQGKTAIVKVLLAGGADINATQSKRGYTALTRAAMSGHAEVVKVLLESGADINARSAGGDTALMGAAESGHVEIVKVLLKSGADINANGGWGYTALMKAAFGRRAEIFKLLLENGADANAKNSDGNTVLISVIKSNESYKPVDDFVKVLLAGVADVNAKGKVSGNLNRAQRRRGRGSVDVNATGSNGATALMHAAAGGLMEVVKMLLESGADVKAKDNNGDTALWWAVRAAYPEVVKVLLAGGADEGILSKAKPSELFPDFPLNPQNLFRPELFRINLTSRADESDKHICLISTFTIGQCICDEFDAWREQVVSTRWPPYATEELAALRRAYASMRADVPFRKFRHGVNTVEVPRLARAYIERVKNDDSVYSKFMDKRLSLWFLSCDFANTIACGGALQAILEWHK